MKAKILSLFLAVVICIFAFAACDMINGGKECDHTFSDKWSTDAANHWYAATCEHGEIKGSLEAHKDENEDGLCDVCEYETGHIHTYESEWTVDDDKHWHKATCSHTDSKGDEGLHKDDNTDGICDTCLGHVHTLDGAGFCHGCDKEIKPVVETEIGSVIYATTARVDRIVGGNIDYYMISRLENENSEIAHVVDFLLGTNGTYSKRTETESVLEKWIEKISADEVKGIFAISVDGAYTDAEPGAFGTDDLAGYYYAVSTLADGHGAEAVLVALYEASLAEGAEIIKTTHDAEANSYKYEYKTLVVHETKLGDGSVVYNANYFEVSLSFTYNDDYVLTSLDITCNCYTNDPGADSSGKILENEIDFDYDPETGKMNWRNPYRADTYEISVTQNVGTRTEIELNDGSEFAPTDFELYLDEEFANAATDIELTVGDNSKNLYIKTSPENSFLSFFKNEFKVAIKDSEGNAATGISATLTGDVIYLIPTKGGEYVLEFSALGKTKTVNATVNEIEVGGANELELEVTSAYGWENYYEFTPATPGVYTFYLPAYFGIWEKSDYDSNKAPLVDAFQPGTNDDERYGGYNPTLEHTVTVTLKPGQKFCFYFGATMTGTFTIGYDAP